MPKVVIIDNFGRDYISDSLHKDNLSMGEVIELAKEKNNQTNDNSPYFYIAKEDDYILFDPYKDLP